jgi:hypothetical protein
MSALTRNHSYTVAARLRRDGTIGQALLVEAMNLCLAGDVRAAKAILRDLLSVTVDYKDLAAGVRKTRKSLYRMLAPRGNLSAENLFGIVRALQKNMRVPLRATAD